MIFFNEGRSTFLQLFGFLYVRLYNNDVKLQKIRTRINLELTLLRIEKNIYPRNTPNLYHQDQDRSSASNMYPISNVGAICENILWKAVACSQQNCFANFC